MQGLHFQAAGAMEPNLLLCLDKLSSVAILAELFFAQMAAIASNVNFPIRV